MPAMLKCRYFSHSDAQRQFRGGVPVPVLAKRYAVSRQAIYSAMSDADRLARIASGGSTSAATRAVREKRAREMRATGMSQKDIAKALGFNKDTVTRLTRGVKPVGWTPPRLVASKPRSVAVASSIPAWIKQNDLVEDYRDHRRLYGPVGAVQHCRRLVAEMQGGSA